ncbi:MAG: zinc ribbon domain-containing protein [Acidobacteriota bacterium]|nr:zinc ribbon domain-containing protein [Acidobacteriota bacterium]
MPLYEYECSACGRRFEVLQSLGSGSKGLTCPHCRGTALEKMLSTFAAAGQDRAAAGGEGGCGSGFT